MRTILAIALLVTTTSISAQSNQSQPTADDIRLVAQAIAEQRNEAQNTIASLSVLLRQRDAEIAQLKKQCGDHCKPKESIKQDESNKKQ